MTNPWVEIPLEDYETHMAAVRQLGVLSDLFGEALMVRRPGSVAVLGVAGGNGLERIERRLTHRVVGIDIAPGYLEAVRRRFADLGGLETHCVDLAREKLHLVPVDLVHAALIFEHAGVERCLENAISLVAPNGALSVVLQLTESGAAAVSETGVASVQKLKEIFTAITPQQMHALLGEHCMEPVWEVQRQQPNGKAFWMGIFVHTAAEQSHEPHGTDGCCC